MVKPAARMAETSSTSSRSVHDEKDTNRDASAALRDHTEANILPDTAEEPALSDEKEAQISQDITDVEKEQEVLAPTDPRSFPDGGLEAWLVCLGAFCCLFCSFGWINCVGVFQDYYQRKLLSSYSPSTIAWIPSLEIFMMFAGGPVYGKIFDDYGPRYLLGIGSFFHVFGLMMTSNASQYYQILLGQGICSSLGSSAVFYAATSSLATWFFQRRALAFGITAAGSSVGGVIFPILVQRLIPQVGFPWAMRTAAFLILFMLIIANLTLKSRLAPNPRRFDIMDFIRPMKELPFDVVMLASFLTFFGIFIPFNYIILQAQAAGMSQELSSYILAIVNGVSVFGRTIPGYLGDKMGRFNVISIMNLMAGIMVLAVWIPARNNVGIIVFGAFYGFFSGAFVSMIPACIAQISDIRQIGVRTGTIYAITSAAALCGNPVAGALVGSGGNFLHLQIFCGVTIVAGSVAFVSARVVLVGPKLLEKC